MDRRNEDGAERNDNRRKADRQRPAFPVRGGGAEAVAFWLEPVFGHDAVSSCCANSGKGASCTAPNTFSNDARSAPSASCIVTGKPRSTRLVTPNCGPEMPHGVMPEKCS